MSKTAKIKQGIVESIKKELETVENATLENIANCDILKSIVHDESFVQWIHNEIHKVKHTYKRVNHFMELLKQKQEIPENVLNIIKNEIKDFEKVFPSNIQKICEKYDFNEINPNKVLEQLDLPRCIIDETADDFIFLSSALLAQKTPHNIIVDIIVLSQNKNIEYYESKNPCMLTKDYVLQCLKDISLPTNFINNLDNNLKIIINNKRISESNNNKIKNTKIITSMFDMYNASYEEVINYLKNNLPMKYISPCEKIQYEADNKNLYELVIVTMDADDFDDTPSSEKYHYHILKYNDETFYHELSVLDCGGYYVAMCIFENKINICKNVFYHKKYSDEEDIMHKYHISTQIKNN